MDEQAGFIIALIGMWLFSDSLYSIILYMGKPDELFWRNHLIRVVRLTLSVILIIMGGVSVY